ncbi:hypothetical protein [Isoptericola croceus]|uniref:hypothetical protein n=1 Tax=Isoptericola croceus TaxID=3031406 RepID=UPI0023F8957C|nr:hypothetical protein [Isoptericola croceus]
MWGGVWTVLVLCALVFLGWIVWGVVSAGLRLMREAGEAGQTFGAASQRVSDAVAQAEAARADTSPTMFDPPAELHARVQRRREVRRGRRDDRRGRQAATWQVWRTSSWLERRQSRGRSAAPPRVPKLETRRDVARTESLGS